MALLDRAVKMAAELDESAEDNYVRKHAMETAAEMQVSVREAATRVFSNSAGSYSANVGLAVENEWGGRDTRDTEKELDKVTRPVTIWARSVETKATSYGNA